MMKIPFRAGVVVVSLGAVLTLASCVRSNSLTEPSGSSSFAQLDTHNSPGVSRHYKATIALSPVVAGSSSSQSITFINCNTAVCGAGNETSNAQQTIKSAEIVPPPGFALTSITNVSTSSGDSWSANIVNGTIILGAIRGTDALSLGESVTVTFNLTAASVCGFHTWGTNAYQDTLSAGALVRTTPYELVGTQPQTEVTNCNVQAQGCSPGFWKNLTRHAGDWQSYAPGDSFSSVFGRIITVGAGGQSTITNPTLLQALASTGGGDSRTARIGTAALLSAAHTDVAFPYTTVQVITAVQNAIDGIGGAISIDDLEDVWKEVLDHCPLGSDPLNP
jgi:hypothetical protein